MQVPLVEHPFVKALFAEALVKLRPLVEEERQREEHRRATIESEATRRRLDALEKAALNFMRDYQEDEEPARDPEGKDPESRFTERGYSLSPPFTQMIVGHSRLFWLNISQKTFPEFEVGSTVQIECLSDEITTDRRYCGLEPHPKQNGVLRAIWKVTARDRSTATGVLARVGSITAEAIIEVLSSEADRYRNVTDLRFNRKRYNVRTDRRSKGIKILVPLKLVDKPTPIEIDIDSRHFKITGQRIIQPIKNLEVAMCDLKVKSDGQEARGELIAKLGDEKATAKIASINPLGADLSIKLEDIDIGNDRSRWRQNVLEIAARHPSLRRYLGDKQHGFPGQETKHFRLLLAEVVADAVCGRLVRRYYQNNPEEFEDADWDTYYAIYSKFMTRFLPIAHKLQCPDSDI